jgi:hypothetical protein
MRAADRRPWLAFAAVAFLFGAFPSAAIAQGAWPGRIVVSANGGAQSTSQAFSDQLSFPLYVEDAIIGTDYAVASAPFFDAGAVVRIWRTFGVGVAVSRFTDDRAASIEGELPHPFQFGQPRTIEGEASNLRRRETSGHLQIAWMGAPTSAIRFIVSAGPSWIRVEQGLITGVNYDEAYPYDVVTFTGVDRVLEKEEAVGFNAGVDVLWVFAKHVGLGGLVRFSRATATVSPAEGRALELELGGLHGGGGIRILF